MYLYGSVKYTNCVQKMKNFSLAWGQNWTKFECLKCRTKNVFDADLFIFNFQFFQPSSCKTKWRGRCSKWNPISQRDFIRHWGKVCLFNLQRRDEKLSSNAGHQSFDKRLEMKRNEKKNHLESLKRKEIKLPVS